MKERLLSRRALAGTINGLAAATTAVCGRVNMEVCGPGFFAAFALLERGGIRFSFTNQTILTV